MFRLRRLRAVEKSRTARMRSNDVDSLVYLQIIIIIDANDDTLIDIYVTCDSQQIPIEKQFMCVSYVFRFTQAHLMENYVNAACTVCGEMRNRIRQLSRHVCFGLR